MKKIYKQWGHLSMIILISLASICLLAEANYKPYQHQVTKIGPNLNRYKIITENGQELTNEQFLTALTDRNKSFIHKLNDVITSNGKYHGVDFESKPFDANSLGKAYEFTLHDTSDFDNVDQSISKYNFYVNADDNSHQIGYSGKKALTKVFPSFAKPATLIAPISKPNRDYYAHLKIFLKEGDMDEIYSFWQTCGQRIRQFLGKGNQPVFFSTVRYEPNKNWLTARIANDGNNYFNTWYINGVQPNPNRANQNNQSNLSRSNSKQNTHQQLNTYTQKKPIYNNHTGTNQNIFNLFDKYQHKMTKVGLNLNRYRITKNGKPVTNEQVLTALLDNGDADLMIKLKDIITSNDNEGVIFESKPFDNSGLDDTYEFTLLDTQEFNGIKQRHRQLQQYTNDYQNKQNGVSKHTKVFPDYAKAVTLVAPKKTNQQKKYYAHLKVFLQNANQDEVYSFWQTCVTEIRKMLNNGNNQPVFFSTTGKLKDNWLTARIENHGTFYRNQLYKNLFKNQQNLKNRRPQQSGSNFYEVQPVKSNPFQFKVKKLNNNAGVLSNKDFFDQLAKKKKNLMKTLNEFITGFGQKSGVIFQITPFGQGLLNDDFIFSLYETNEFDTIKQNSKQFDKYFMKDHEYPGATAQTKAFPSLGGNSIMIANRPMFDGTKERQHYAHLKPFLQKGEEHEIVSFWQTIGMEVNKWRENKDYYVCLSINGRAPPKGWLYARIGSDEKFYAKQNFF